MDPAKQDLSAEPPPCTEQPEASLCQNEQLPYTIYHNCVPSQNPQSTYRQSFPASVFQDFPAGCLSPALNGQQAQTTVVLTQQGRCSPREIDNTLPPNYLSLSLLTVCCCFPLGVSAIITSCMVDAAVRRGDVDAARKASFTTKLLVTFGIVIGSVLLLLFLLFVTRIF